MSKFKKILFLGLGVVILGTVGYFFVCNMTFSDGTRSGYLIKVSHKGFPVKTYEGQLNLGGVGTGEVNTIVSNNIWDFSVPDEEVYKKVEAMQGKHVKVWYKEKLKAFSWQGDTNYFVYQIEEVK
ncbi:MAG: 6-phosphogluconate dehydrogenase [Bacteroidia bacterium]|nr:6-phosphogluconate dehydrogenase [Bacteroidia bacterium]